MATRKGEEEEGTGIQRTYQNVRTRPPPVLLNAVSPTFLCKKVGQVWSAYFARIRFWHSFIPTYVLQISKQRRRRWRRRERQQQEDVLRRPQRPPPARPLTGDRPHLHRRHRRVLSAGDAHSAAAPR